MITKDVEKEIVTTPMNIQKYKLGAIRLKKLIDEGILEFPESLGIDKNVLNKKTNDVLHSANSLFYADGKPVHIIDIGEGSVLALSMLLREKKIDNLVAMDERTARMLCEKPENLQKLLESKLHTKISLNGKYEMFRGIDFVRSTELIYIAFKNGIIKTQTKDMLDAMLYGAKFKGAAISSDEIREIERM